MSTLKKKGTKIQMKLMERKGKGRPYTQRWLLSELRKDAFPNLSEYRLSNILNGYYTIGYASDVLHAAEKILAADDHENAERVS